MAPNQKSVQEMFNAIAGRYDFLNHFLSLGIDTFWRKRLRNALSDHFKGKTLGISVLDVASGTGDVALELCRLNPASVTATDISMNMMDLGREKAIKRGAGNIITFICAPAEELPFPDAHFDAITVAFGVRNFENLKKGLSEMHRVVRPSGIVLVLEFSQPSGSPLRQLYSLYSRTIIPFFGRLISRHKEAYSYLPQTAAAFPSGESFLSILRETGFTNCTQTILSGGIATLYKAGK